VVCREDHMPAIPENPRPKDMEPDAASQVDRPDPEDPPVGPAEELDDGFDPAAAPSHRDLVGSDSVRLIPTNSMMRASHPPPNEFGAGRQRVDGASLQTDSHPVDTPGTRRTESLATAS